MLLGRSGVSLLVVSLTLNLALMVAGGAAAASGRTVISLGFDDGYSSQYGVRSMLSAHGMHATFFIFSGGVGDVDDGYMTWSQVADLEADGHEIGGHTVEHVDLTTVSAAVARQQVCDDRAALSAHGLHVSSFAYPYGKTNPQVERIVSDCGYTSARTTGWYGFTCPSPCTESIPPHDAFATTVIGFSDQTLAELQAVVTNAEKSTGWGQIVIHQVCDAGCGITAATFNAFLDWLQTRVAAGAIEVKTIQDVMSEAPSIPETSITAGPPAVTADASPSFSFASDATSGVTFACRLNGPGAVTGEWGACASPEAYAGLADGSYTFGVRATNAAGTDQTPAARSFRVDTVAPGVPVITLPVQNSWNALGLVVLSGSAEASSTVEVLEGALSRGVVVADGVGSWSLTLTGVADGAHAYVARSSDVAGNTSGASAPRTVRVDTVAPGVTIAEPVDGSRLRLGAVVLADYGCSDGGGAASIKTCTGPVAAGAMIDTQTPGGQSFTVAAEDLAGNTGSRTVHYIVDDSAPLATITAPAQGARYARDEVVSADWVCTDADGPADIDTRPVKTFGTRAPGEAVDTATLGLKAFSVTCTDLAGNATTITVEYTVIDVSAPGITISVPADGAH